MKYAELNEYKKYLVNTRRLAKTTADTYYNRMDILLEGQIILKTIDFEKIMNQLATIKYKNTFSKAKNALFYYLEFKNVELDKHLIFKIEELEKNTHKKYRKLEKKEYQKIDRTIKHLKNERLKLSFRTILETGLRVSELSQLTPNNCMIDNNKILFTFTGKGGKTENVTIIKTDNLKLYERLKQKIELTTPTQKIFYSANYLQQKAHHYGFQCHDLRRACAKQEYKKTKSKNEVQKKLRHSKAKTTNIYLKSKIKM